MEKTIQRTKDYDYFLRNKFQRKLDVKNLIFLEKELLKNGEFDTPITINENKIILDGHHRFEILKKHNKEIEYYVINREEKYIKNLNERRGKNWGLEQVIKINADLGKQTYKKLIDLKNNNNITISNVANIYINNYSGRLYDKITNGELTNNDIDVLTGNKILKVLKLANQKIDKKSIDALKYFFKNNLIDSDELIYKIKLTNKDIRGISVSEVKLNIEKIYNYKRKNNNEFRS
jgi:hypothetical protein